MTNQLVQEAEAIPDLDEFSLLSIRDIAAALTYWPEGSDEEARAVAAIRSRAGIGHNNPPLNETLEDELAPHKHKTQQLVEIAGSAAILRDENAEASAGKVTDTIALIRGLENDLNAMRLQRSRPYREAQKIINDAYEQLTVPLAAARAELTKILTQYDDERKAAIEAERQRALAEQRQREEEAAAARRRAEEAAGRSVGAELAALQAAEEAERAAARASAIRAAPIRSHLGTVTRRKQPKSQITDPIKFSEWLLEQATYRNHFLHALQTIAGTIVRDAGVDAISEGLDIPGLKAWVEQGQASLRR